MLQFALGFASKPVLADGVHNDKQSTDRRFQLLSSGHWHVAFQEKGVLLIKYSLALYAVP